MMKNEEKIGPARLSQGKYARRGRTTMSDTGIRSDNDNGRNDSGNGSQFPQCEHLAKALRRMVQSNGVEVAVYQCLDCGRNCGATPKAKLPGFAALPLFDRILQEAHQQKWKARWEQQQAERQREREEADQEWWDRYHAYVNMDNPAWIDLRNRVFARCKGMCEGCNRRPMVHVHHLTYVRLGAEMLFDVVGICKPCHDQIHGRDTSQAAYVFSNRAGPSGPTAR
jgi:hypothetical protein